MKTFIAFSLLFSSVAFACPELAGTYKACLSNDGSAPQGKIVIEQTLVDGNTSYTMRGYTTDEQYVRFERNLLADGVLYGFRSNDNGYEFINKYKDSCQNNALVHEVEGSLPDGYVFAKAVVTYSKEGSKLLIKQETAPNGDAGEVFITEYVCE